MIKMLDSPRPPSGVTVMTVGPDGRLQPGARGKDLSAQLAAFKAFASRQAGSDAPVSCTAITSGRSPAMQIDTTWIQPISKMTATAVAEFTTALNPPKKVGVKNSKKHKKAKDKPKPLNTDEILEQLKAIGRTRIPTAEDAVALTQGWLAALDCMPTGTFQDIVERAHRKFDPTCAVDITGFRSLTDQMLLGTNFNLIFAGFYKYKSAADRKTFMANLKALAKTVWVKQLELNKDFLLHHLCGMYEWIHRRGNTREPIGLQFATQHNTWLI